MKRNYFLIEVAAVIVIIADFLVTFMLPADIEGYQDICDLSSMLFMLVLILEFGYLTYFRICVSSWLKNKYNIKRW